MKKIALTVLVACLCLEAGCSKPTEQAPVVTASPTVLPVTKEQRRQKEATKEAIRARKQADLTPQQVAPTTEAVTQAPSPSPVSSPQP